jgi:RNA polymerase sigma factor (sigma-70 family)
LDHQRLLLDHLDLVNQIVRTVGRRRHLSSLEIEDLGSFVHLRLVADDYAILRKFQHRSSLWTYLAAVIERLSLDFCTEKWGRWRPSVVAERLGPAAVVLERLIHRDAHTLDEALEIVRTNHDLGLSEGRLRDLWQQLPVRVRTSHVGEEAADLLPSDDSSESGIEDADRREIIKRLQGALATALNQLSAQDRVAIALRFDQDLSLAQIAGLTGSSVATLHRRLDKSVKQLRSALSLAGFDPREVAGLIGHASIGLSPLLRAEVEKFLGPVRLSKRDG